ncbi:SGNH/GDSL hydrolase family protein [Nocardioides terrisoli]|uniref:SGNH/GDSL hydrolase family protein n=1 Tax=Nocardioides terrisoli TaxID=3388267 RepID=UPI00287B7FD7|nr:SGNH/GDSL hydrolase family protein [Nocardioides marmorisolisilvae]
MEVVLLGDSHLARIRRALPRISANAINAAVGGATAADVLTQARAHLPTTNAIAVLSIGTNDARRGTRPEECRELVKALVAELACPWIYVRPPLTEHAVWGNAIASLRPDHLIDTPALLAPLGARAIASDGVHLTGSAYELLLPEICTALSVV